jgi:hypothetical protein
MQAHVVFTASNAVKSVEPTDGVMALENTHTLAKMREPDARREAGHARANNSDVVVRLGIHEKKMWASADQKETQTIQKLIWNSGTLEKNLILLPEFQSSRLQKQKSRERVPA